MRPFRVLYFAPMICWPLRTGGQLRNYYLARELARRAEVVYVGIGNEEQSLSEKASLRQAYMVFDKVVCFPQGDRYTLWKLCRGLVGNTPISILNYMNRSVARQLELLLKESRFDVIQIGGIHLADYIPIIRAVAPRSPILCDWQNIESDVMSQYSKFVPNAARRLYARRTASLLRGAERRLITACDAHTVVSEQDAARLHQVAARARVYVLENGVDVEHYSAATTTATGLRSTVLSPRIVFVGSMDYHANVDAVVSFVREVWPVVRCQYHHLHFFVVGSNPVTQVRELQKFDGVTVTGTVDDVRPFYRGALAAVVPLRVGGGSRLKILEGMAAGVPIISTRLGAEGLQVEHGKNIIFAETTEETVAAISYLHQSEQARQSLARAGQELVRRRYDWMVLGEHLYNICLQLAAETGD